MAQRLIRDGMLESERVHSLPVEGRWLFMTVLLSADDVGLLELNQFRLSRLAGLDQRSVSKLLPMLADADLIRPYQVGEKTFAFIPRYAQRLQIKRSRCPLPPQAILEGDGDALKKINDLGAVPTVDHGESRISTAIQPPEPEPEPIEALTTSVGRHRAKSAKPAADPPPDFDGENESAISSRAVVKIAARFDLPEQWGLDAEALGFKGREVITEAEKFRQYWTAGKGHGTRRSVRGWRQAWSNWLARAARNKQ